MAVQYNPGIVTEGLVLYLDAANRKSYPGTGTISNDLSNIGNNGTLVNGVSYSTTNSGIFTFDGTNDMITTTTSFVDPEAYSLVVWFKTSSASGKKIIGFENNQTGISTTQYDRHLYVNTSGNLVYGIYNGGFFYATSTVTVNNNQWFCACTTYGSEGATARLYLNGISNATVTITGNENYTGFWRIGGYKLASWNLGADGYFPGSIGNIMIYNKGLNSSEVLQNFNALRGRFGI
jgi:hypothetical protein